MNGASARVFPDTVPSERLLFPLVHVFGRLVYLQAVENDAVPPELRNPLCDEMARESLLGVEVPAPLHADRDRFVRLLADLRNRRDDYAARLRHVALAGMSSASRPRAESRSSILTMLLSGGGLTGDGADGRTMLLWQARLILKLGEMFDAEQALLDAELRRIREKEEQLLNRLRSEEEAVFPLTGGLAAAASPASEDMGRLRCRAWARLFALGDAPLEQAGIFLSADADAVDLLLEQFEIWAGEKPQHLLSCRLPAAYPDGEGLVGRIHRFRSESAGLLEKLNLLAGNLAAGPRPNEDLWSGEEEDAWEKLLARMYPEETFGRTRLSLYYCPRISPPRLFLDTFAPGRDEVLTAAVPGEGQGLVLGVLRRA